jgi:hypothetical protein
MAPTSSGSTSTAFPDYLGRLDVVLANTARRRLRLQYREAKPFVE